MLFILEHVKSYNISTYHRLYFNVFQIRLCLMRCAYYIGTILIITILAFIMIYYDERKQKKKNYKKIQFENYSRQLWLKRIQNVCFTGLQIELWLTNAGGKMMRLFFSSVMKIKSDWYFMLLLDSQGMISFIAKRIKKRYLTFFYRISEMKWRRNKTSESLGSLFSCQGRGVYEVRRFDLSLFFSYTFFFFPFS